MPASLPTWRRAALALAAMSALGVQAQTVPELNALAAKEQPALMKTLQQLVEIESGSSDRQGLDRIAGVIAQRLRELGGNSLDRVEVATCTMQDLKVSIASTQLARVQSIGELVDVFVQHLSERADDDSMKEAT